MEVDPYTPSAPSVTCSPRPTTACPSCTTGTGAFPPVDPPIIQDCDVRSGNYLMTQSDIDLLNKMYQWMVVGVTGQHSLPLVPSVGMVTDTGRRTIHFVIVTYVKHYF